MVLGRAECQRTLMLQALCEDNGLLASFKVDIVSIGNYRVRLEIIDYD